MSRLSLLSLAALLLTACPSDDAGDEGSSGDPSTSGTQDTGTSESDESGGGDPVCIPDGGAYGPCSESLCYCIVGGDVYQYCTQPCTDASDCGDPAELPGATPACEPVTPGEPDMACVLGCQASADCPCGLECDSTYKICAEPQ